MKYLDLCWKSLFFVLDKDNDDQNSIQILASTWYLSFWLIFYYSSSLVLGIRDTTAALTLL